MKFQLACIYFVTLGLISVNGAHAHKSSDSYLRLVMNEHLIHGQWDIALRDLNVAIGLDVNEDGRITWGETRSRHAFIATHALSRLQFSNRNSLCESTITEHLIDYHSDGAYAVLKFVTQCPVTPTILNINYGLLFDVDPLHRGFMRMEGQGRTKTAVFSPERATIQLELLANTPWHEFLQFSQEGIRHIWLGYDHILFLISLLLPAVLWWRDGQWEAVNSFGPAFAETFKIITAFTVAHSLTLCLSVLKLVTLPSQGVETVIAGSVVLAALHNLYPVVEVRRWIVALGFGLIHGFGFASVLNDLVLPTASLFVALAGFNLGVELGQIAIVSLFLPFAYVFRRSWTYRSLIVPVGSLCIAGLAMTWLIERSLALSLENWPW